MKTVMMEVTNSSKKEVNSNCESGSSTIDVEYGLPPELVTKFSCSVPFTLPPHKTALVAAILDGYVSFNGKGIISPSDLNSLQGGNMVEENNYLTNFIVDTYFEITQAARADGSKVVVFPWEAFEKSAIKLLFTGGADNVIGARYNSCPLLSYNNRPLISYCSIPSQKFNGCPG